LADIVGRFRAPSLAAAPPSPAPGEQYYDTTQNALFYWNGTTWVSVVGPALSASPGDLIVSAAATRGGALLCDGSAVSRTTYSALFAAIGTVYGAGDGSSTFNLPDYRGRVILGAGAGAGLTNRVLGTSGGEEAHLLASTEMPVHAHIINGAATGMGVSDPTHGHSSPATIYNTGPTGTNMNNFTTGTGATGLFRTNNLPTNNIGTGITLTDPTHAHIAQTAGGGAGHNNMQPWGTANVFIKI
jgi:microcystin-dependent protein